MIFITLGSQKFQFNRLLKKIDEMIENKIIEDEVFAQVGASDYQPKNFAYRDFMDGNTFCEMQEKSDIVITHGGTGAIIGAVKKGKKVIAVPRLEKYGEHVDNHQIQLLKEFDGMGIIEVCYDLSELEVKLCEIKNKTYSPYISNTNKIIDSIQNFIERI